MTQVLSPIILDFETVELLPGGSTKASVDAYKANFRVSSAATCWRNPDNSIGSEYAVGEEEVRTLLAQIGKTGQPIIAHNILYERLVAKCRFADIALNWHADTMRLAQLFDNGGDKNLFEIIIDEEWVGDPSEVPTKRKPLSGLGLAVCNKRILAGSDHKAEAYNWIRANISESSGKEGAFLDKLPADIMRRYNLADVYVTLDLYEFITEYFKKIGFNWSLDNSLYMSTVGYLVDAKIRGARIDRATLAQNITANKQQIKEIEDGFLANFSTDISAILSTRLELYVNKPGKNGPPTEKRMQMRRDKISSKGLEKLKLHYNPGSNKQLAELFMDRQKLEPKFFTKKGAPSFRSVHLNQWGVGGEMLAARRKKLIIQTQMESLLALSEYDGRWHPDIKPAAASTGRMAGGNGGRGRGPKLNPQALARRSPELMRCILPEINSDNVSIDLSSGEPSVSTHFSQDENYRWATFDGIGKAPYYDGPVLMISDIYLQCMSVSPMGKDRMRVEFNKKWPAGTFAEQWVKDPDVIKAALKKERQFHKILALGLGYSMGPKKMVNAAYDAGYTLSFNDAKEFHRAYWDLYSGIRHFSDQITKQIERDGYIVNPFGYRSTCEPRKGFNAFIQGSVSGIMHVFLAILGARAPYASLCTVIHDELVMTCPKDKLDLFRLDKEWATDQLNQQLNWSLKIQCGWAPGSNWYEAK